MNHSIILSVFRISETPFWQYHICFFFLINVQISPRDFNSKYLFTVLIDKSSGLLNMV